MMFRFLLVFILSSQLFSFGCSKLPESGRVSKTVILMGTFVQVVVYNDSYSHTELSEILEEAFEVGKKLESKLSNFEITSEINILNIERKKIVSSDLFEILSLSKEISRVTNGEFDITVSPILKKNGFYKNMPEVLLEKIPDDVNKMGFENILINSETQEVELLNDVWLDSSGISKGYIVDKISDFFISRSVKKFLVNAGGDIYCNSSINGRGWVIGVKNPKNNTISLVINLKQNAVATSGDYENVVVEEETERLLSHIVDPSKKTVQSQQQISFTVIANTCREADALATGMMAMEKERAIILANSLDDVELIVINGEKDEITYSSGAKKYILDGRGEIL